MTPPVSQTRPEYVIALEAAYGAPSQAAFGSAVFYEPSVTAGDLEQAALAKYRFFVGKLWERYGEEAWLGPWKKVYARQPGATADVVAELRGITDSDARSSAAMILDTVQDVDQARAALAATFDDAAVTELSVYNIGDGAAMSGLLIAARRAATGEALFLVFLMD
jgi:hypothetical protein